MTGLSKFSIVIGILAAIVVIAMKLASLSGPAQIDEHTKKLCREWAAADHSGGVPPERLKWLKEQGAWDEFDWYGSCIENNSPNRFDQIQTTGGDNK